ncbi:MAG: Ferrous iron transport protein B [Pelotomaculum sp. PtaU1.Bin035]|nr:MAG: Ferrous iron transport protein B [Pelotomaculum sp. PtaU1.Bin035]
MNRKNIVIALAGNPNSGKTTIFNAITGARQHVGNYPGVTVERKEGRVKYKGHDITVIDLPGTYGLSDYSPDEVVARRVIIEEKPDILVNVVDASNLERNLYLTMQIKELEVPVIMVLNMADVAEKNKVKINYEMLSQLLGLPVIRAVGSKNEGIDEILEAVINCDSVRSSIRERQVRYRPEIEKEMSRLEEQLQSLKHLGLETAAGVDEGVSFLSTPSRWLLTGLLGNDKLVSKQIAVYKESQSFMSEVEQSRMRLNNLLGDDPEMALVEDRYAFTRGICREACQRSTLDDKLTLTEKIDNVMLNRVLGIPIFLGLMWLLFQLTFTLGSPPMDWIDAGVSTLGDWLNANMADGMLRSLLVDGIVGGVGGIIVFLPNILLLFLGIAFLEGTGYMARAAFVMDQVMHKAGLHGKSFVPMLIGFGCGVPALMASRTLENPRDRLVTMLVTPLMSCGARLPVYSILTAAFFPGQMGGNILFSIYLLGIFMAIVMARIFRTWVLPGDTEPFVMELPTYQLPTIRNILIHMWERTWLYLKKAGTILLAISILMWGLFTFPTADSRGGKWENSTVQLENSYAGQLGRAIAPVFQPLGFDWKTSVALVAGLGAKEVVVSTLGTLYSIEDEEALAGEEGESFGGFAERAREQSGYTPLVAYVLMIFTLLYVPCMAFIAVMKRETNGWKWPLFTIAYTLILAWVVSFLAYRGGLLLGIGI